MSRTEILQLELNRLLPLLAGDPTVQRVVVFGSAAAGNIHEESDLDLVVVQDTPLSFWERLRAMRRRLKPDVGVDLLVYTPAEYRELCSTRPFVREEIGHKGHTLYERCG